jgi:tetratricopeptide (TPR) repeat protein
LRGGDRPRRDFGGDRGFDRRSGGGDGGGRSFGGERRPEGDRPRWQGGDRDPGRRDDRRDGGYRGREGNYGRDGGDRGSSGYGGDRGSSGYQAGQDRPSYSRPGDNGRAGRGGDRPGRSQGFSRTMSDRIGGAFPDDRPARSPRPGGAGRPGSRGPSFGSGDRSGRSSGYRDERPGADRGRPHDRRDERPRSGSVAPRIPDSITDDQVSREVRDELGSLSLDRAIIVGRYLVAAELATDPELAHQYAQAAKRMAARIGIVREVSGVRAYRSGRWAEALSELQAGRRMTGRNDYLPLMADSERGLGRLDRALDLVHSAEAKRLPRAAQIELRIVESGVRRDQGLADAAVLALQVPELTDGKQRPWSARLFYAYGEALIAAGRIEAAREAFSRAVVADEDEETDALARLDELDGITVTDLEDDDEDDDEDDFAEDDDEAADLDDNVDEGEADDLDAELDDEAGDEEDEEDQSGEPDDDLDELAGREDEEPAEAPATEK